ncbi:MAG: nuclear transport factor 2 family protein [Alphaproteobacteria bacterium]|nr:nuclear transport factor 2 family protein [Alphaproteobacteria bacterium]
MTVEAPKGYEPSAPPVFDGGAQADRDALLKLYYDFRLANDGLDNDKLRKVWSAAPQCVYFNTNGHAYHGIDDWLHIWDHYRTRLKLVKPGGSGTIRITIRGDMALITDDDVGRYWDWMGAQQKPDFLVDKPYIRATQVCLKEPEGWRVIHAHFSSGRRGQRPDQGGDE